MALREAGDLGAYCPGLLDSDCVDLVKRLINRAYAWLEENPITALLMSAGLSGLAVLSVVGLGIYSQSTFVQKTACTRDPSSAACAQVRQEVARAEPIENPCISLQRVSGTKGRNCPRFFIPHRGKRQVQANSKEVQSLESGSEGQAPTAPKPGGKSGTNQVTSGGTKSPPKSREPQPKVESKPPPVDIPADTTPAPTPESTAPVPTPSTPKASEVEQPGLISPALETVCSLADHLLNLC